ncbi:MAG: hypothetical protein R3F62_24685 [Planctomycetota bacterium]
MRSVTREQVLIPSPRRPSRAGSCSLQETGGRPRRLLALVLFVGLMGGVFVVVSQRLPTYALLIPTLAPLLVYATWQALRAR